MTVALELKPEIEAALQKKAKSNGLAVDVYLQRLIEKDVDRIKSLDEILAPVRRSFEESGLTEEELNELIDEERQTIWEEKKGKRS